jgi:trk system potassium uptake protein TrkH
LGLLDALFTATSAICVTGLVTVDTATALSRFGQWVVLLLIQVGGIGIMTLSTLLLLMAGRRPSLTGRTVIKDTFTHSRTRSPADIIRQVVVYTLVIEAAGAGLLFLRLAPSAGLSEAARQSLFHAVSAFCNAGFSLYSDSLMGFRGDPFVNLTVCALIVSGGIGFLVISEVRSHFPWNRRRWSRLSLHSRLAISVSVLLVAGGTLLFAVFEWQNTLEGMAPSRKLLAALFQSVTTRTAGFNTIPIDRLANETLFLFLLLMTIGACPGSCGGGIKTTTFATLICVGWSRLRGWRQPQVFHRTISDGSVNRALGLTLVSLLVVTATVFVLLMSELGEIAHPDSRGKFLELLFEAVSAFGTVGLSMGVTPVLSPLGKVVIVFAMFVGRLGPLVIAMALGRPREARYQYAEESIMVG